MIYLHPQTNRPTTDVHPSETYQPPVAERRAPHVCRHGFLPAKCLADDCENAEGEE